MANTLDMLNKLLEIDQKVPRRIDASEAPLPPTDDPRVLVDVTQPKPSFADAARNVLTPNNPQKKRQPGSV